MHVVIMRSSASQGLRHLILPSNFRLRTLGRRRTFRASAREARFKSRATMQICGPAALANDLIVGRPANLRIILIQRRPRYFRIDRHVPDPE